MSKTVHFFILLAFLFSSCQQVPVAPEDSGFQDYVANFFKHYWDLHPQRASALGLSQYDAELEIPTEALRARRLAFYRQQLLLLKTFKKKSLTDSEKVDLALLKNEMEKSLWEYNELKEYQWNPSLYNLAEDVSAVMTKTHLSLEQRMQSLLVKLKDVDDYFKEVQRTINRPTQEHLKLAIDQTQGTLNYLKSTVEKQGKKTKLSKVEKRQLQKILKNARKATQSHLAYLKRILRHPHIEGGFSDFRIGPELYRKKFEYELQISGTPEDLYRKALSAKEEASSQIFEAAIELYPKYFGAKLPPKDRQEVITSVLEQVAKKHVKTSEFIKKVRAQIPELVQFIRNKDLLTFDEKSPLEVREMPEYQRGFAIATIDSPGPFEPSRDTFYNVNPIQSLSPKQQESFLREYNDYTMQILNIHEAVPGHYIQIMQSNKANSVVKSVFQNGPLTEGWAVYAERMMLEEGYGQDSPELRLMYYKWFLRVVVNTIMDYEIHNRNLSRAKALHMLMVDAFQEKTEAEGKWTRATLSQVQLLSYFAGFSEIYSLREEVKKSEGEKFRLKDFHDKFLSYGKSPIPQIKKMML